MHSFLILKLWRIQQEDRRFRDQIILHTMTKNFLNYLQTLSCLGLNEGLDKGVCSLGVEGEGISQGLQLRALIEESLLETVATSMEILLDRIQSHVQNSTLLRGHVSYL